MHPAGSSYPLHDRMPVREASASDIGRAIARAWRWIVIPTALALAGSLAFVFLVSPRYTGEAKLLLQAGDSYFTRPGGSAERYDQQAPAIDEQAVASQVQVVMSRDLAREAIRKLGLVGMEEFDPDAGSVGILRRIAGLFGLSREASARPAEDRVLDKYYDNLLVYPVGKSRIVAVEFRSKDPDLSARGANTIADLYLGFQESAKKDQARSATSWLGTNIDALRQKVAAAEARVEEFRTKTGLLMGTGSTTLSAQQLSDLSSQLAQARTAQSDAGAKARLIRDTIRDGRTFDIPDVGNNELIRRLLEQRVSLKAQLALEQRTLLPQHPRIKELNAQLADLEGQLRTAAERTVRMLENDARISGARVESIEASIDSQKKVVSAANENEVQLRALEREARVQREQLETYLGRYREASARDNDYGMPPDARVVSRAVVPLVPSFPKKVPIVAMTTLATLILAIGAVVSRELLGARPSRQIDDADLYEEGPGDDADAGYATRLPRLAASGPVVDARPTTIVAEPAASAMFEREGSAEPDSRFDFRTLIERLGQAEITGRGRRVAVFETEDGSKASLVARGVALTLARSHRTLLVTLDADEDGPVESRPGLTDLVAGEASFAEVIGREPGSKLHRIGTGTLLNEALTTSPESVDLALEAFDSTYDWVVCAVIGPAPKPLVELLAKRADSVVLVSDLEPTAPALVGAYEGLREAGGKDVIVAREQPPIEYDQAA